MSLKQSFTLAIKSLMSSKMRSILTMLGIIIGIASVIILTSLMNGITNMILDQFSGMGTELITVSISGRGGNRRVEPEQIQALIDDNPDVFSGMSPMVSVPMLTVKYKTESLTSSCTAVSEAYK
ncbi:MAG: ABC transporter permease, partial [Clostridia bacterium]|nr:ABC transporter permease [Clostridia bacterium]